MAAPGTGTRLSQLLDIARLIARETDGLRLLERILMTAKNAARADGGTLSFALLVNDTLGIRASGDSDQPIDLRAPPLFDPNGAPNHASVVAHCVHSRQSIRLTDAYTAKGFDFAGARAFDAAQGYRSRSFLTVPMIDHAGAVIGVVQLVNARRADGAPGSFSAADQTYTEALTALAAVTLERQRLIEREQRGRHRAPAPESGS